MKRAIFAVTTASTVATVDTMAKSMAENAKRSQSEAIPWFMPLSVATSRAERRALQSVGKFFGIRSGCPLNWCNHHRASIFGQTRFLREPTGTGTCVPSRNL